MYAYLFLNQIIKTRMHLTCRCLDLQHSVFLATFDSRLHVSQLEKQPHRVLDAGCGTGIWAIEFGANPLKRNRVVHS